jgi:hypothetical protein
MKNLKYVVITLALFAVVIALDACGSKSKSTSTTTTSSTSNKVTSGTKNTDKFAAAEESIKTDVAKACASIKKHYDDFKSSGQASDGFDEILAIQASFTDLADGAVDNNEVKKVNRDLDFTEWYSNHPGPYADEMLKLNGELQDVTDAATTQSQTAEQVENIHKTMKEFQDYMSTSEFGPCDVGAQ